MSNDLIKNALHQMAYGFYAIGSRAGDEVNIMVANWVMQVSFTPRLLAIGLQKKAYSYGLIASGRVFTINIFHKEDSEAIRPFTKGRAKNPDKIANAQYSLAPETGCPIPAGAAAYLECKVTTILDSGGDHHLVIGEVIGGGVMKAGEATNTLTLLDLGWSYAG